MGTRATDIRIINLSQAEWTIISTPYKEKRFIKKLTVFLVKRARIKIEKQFGRHFGIREGC